jgi:type I restriction enzyme M protein
MGFMKDRVHREFKPEDIKKIESAYHNWRKNEAYEDIKGYCKSAQLSEIEKHSFVLTPGRYVGIPDEEDDGIPFEDKMKDLTTTLAQQIEKEKVLDVQLKEQLAKIGYVL